MFRVAAVVLLTFALAPLSAEPREANSRPRVAPHSHAQGLLWKLEKKGVAPSYLFGTMHSSDERITRLPEPVKKTLAQARSFGMEMIVDEAARIYFVEAMQAAEGQGLGELLGPELFHKAAELMREYGVPEEATERMKPWGVLLTLLIPKPGAQPMLDLLLFEKATAQGKRIYQLESVEQQVAVFDSMPLEMQLALLKHAVESHAELPRAVEQSAEAYLARDLKRLWELNERYGRGAGEAAQYYDEFLDRVLYRRNRRMAERISQDLEEGNTFIAMGALHLYGDRGVLKLLEEFGYRVSRVY